MASMNTARDMPVVVDYKRKIWAIGGIGSNYVDLSSVEIYDPVSDSWTYGKPMNEHKGYLTGCLFSADRETTCTLLERTSISK